MFIRMKRSIKKEMALVFIFLMAFTMVACFLINFFFLDLYYGKQKQGNLEEAFYFIKNGVENDEILTEEYGVELQKKCDQYNLDILILDSKSKLLLSTTAETQSMMNQLFRQLLQMDDVQGEVVRSTEEYQICLEQDLKTKTEYMQLVGYFSDGTLFLMRTPMAGVQDSAMISNRFFAYIGLGAIVLGALVVYYISKKITEPISQLTDISLRMAKLDFETIYTGSSKNEIAILGQNMNHLAGKLKNTISELKNANLELQNDLKLKNEAEVAQKEFVANVSHELKTPIALIQGYAEGLVDDPNMEYDDQKYYCHVIVDEAIKMNEVVQKLITLNQWEVGKEQSCIQRFCITEFIEGCLQTMDIMLKQKNITVYKNWADDIFVWADEYQVSEVFGNFMTNAMNHVKAPYHISIRLELKTEKVRIIIFNTGNPIPEESLNRIWDKFYKVDGAHTREYGGSGIGLSIVKAIMNSMGQEYGVINYDDGVAFWFELDVKS